MSTNVSRFKFPVTSESLSQAKNHASHRHFCRPRLRANCKPPSPRPASATMSVLGSGTMENSMTWPLTEPPAKLAVSATVESATDNPESKLPNEK